MKRTLASAAATGNACVAHAASQFKDLAARTPLDGGEPSLSQQASVDLITASEARLLVGWHEETTKCRTNLMTILYQTVPTVADASEKTHLKTEKILLALLQRRITWGEANSQLAKARAELKHDMLEARRQINTDLANEDAVERASQSVTTNCTQDLNNVKCTTY